LCRARRSRRSAKGVAHCDKAVGDQLQEDIERITWLLWHGNQHRALQTIAYFEDDVDVLEIDYQNLGKFARTAREFSVEISNNIANLINYGERFRSGERISSCLAE
jgi:hypothetical protein